MASQGPLACGSNRENSFSESPQTRASAMPGMTAACSSCSVNGVRAWSFCASLATRGGTFLLLGAFLRSATFWACAEASSSCGDDASTVQISSPAAKPR